MTKEYFFNFGERAATWRLWYYTKPVLALRIKQLKLNKSCLKKSAKVIANLIKKAFIAPAGLGFKVGRIA